MFQTGRVKFDNNFPTRGSVSAHSGAFTVPANLQQPPASSSETLSMLTELRKFDKDEIAASETTKQLHTLLNDKVKCTQR